MTRIEPPANRSFPWQPSVTNMGYICATGRRSAWQWQRVPPYSRRIEHVLQWFCSSDVAQQSGTATKAVPDFQQSEPCDGGISSGAFLNLCGVCVGGKTGRDPGEGLDQCGVCYGTNSCVGCDGTVDSGTAVDSCGSCLPLHSPAWNNCTKITSAWPKMLDRADGVEDTLNLRGAGLNPDALGNVTCTLVPTSGSQPVVVRKTLVEDGIIELLVMLSPEDGIYQVQCVSSVLGDIQVEEGMSVTVVDSRSLAVSRVTPNMVLAGQSFKATLELLGVRAGQEVFCYVRTDDNSVAQVLDAVEVLEGRVVCSNYTTNRAVSLQFGVVYTEDSAMDRGSTGTPGKVMVSAAAPRMVGAMLSADLREIHIMFSRNMEGASNCSQLFTTDTLDKIGRNANCSFRTNRLVVELGDGPQLSPDTELSLLDAGSVKLDTSQAEAPNFYVIAPQFVCANGLEGSSLGRRRFYASANVTGLDDVPAVWVVAEGSQRLLFDWSLFFSVADTGRRTQRQNLLVWESVRGLQADMKRSSRSISNGQVPVNISLMTPGVTYLVNVTASNVLGRQSEVRNFSVYLAPKGSNNTELLMLGSRTTYSDTDYIVEARLSTCDHSILNQTLLYQWSVTQGDKEEVNVGLQSGRRLRLAAGSLRGGQQYHINCTVWSESRQMLVIGTLAITTVMRGVQAVLIVTELTIGTGQPLYLDASMSYDPDNQPGELQFLWCCRKVDNTSCAIGKPGLNHSAEQDTFTSSVLNLSPGTLSLGEYIFVALVSKGSNTSAQAACKVVVVPGSPAVVHVQPDVRLTRLNPAENATVHATVKGVREFCRLWWSVLDQPGYQYFDLAGLVGVGNTVYVTDEEMQFMARRRAPSKEFPLFIPGPTGKWSGLLGDSQYKLRLTASCPVFSSSLKTVQSYADIIISTNSPPITKRLQVTPSEGEALLTRFTFTTQSAYDSAEDFPLQYKYGYRVRESSAVHVFSTSSVELQAHTLLPCTGEGSMITPVLNVCDSRQLCTSIQGNLVKTRPPRNVTLDNVEAISAELRQLMVSQQYSEALNLGQVMLHSLKMVLDQTLYQEAGRRIEHAISMETARLKTSLKSDPKSIMVGLDFIGMAVKTLEELPMSSATLQQLASFRNEILGLEAGRARKKRDTTTMGHALSVELVKSFLTISEMIISNNNSSGAAKEKSILLRQIHTYVTGLCKGPDVTEDKPAILEFRILTLSVEKVSAKHRAGIMMDIPKRRGARVANLTASVKFGSSMSDVLKDGPVCLGAIMLPEDYLSQTDNVTPVDRRSAVFGAHLTRPDKNGVISLGWLEPPVSVTLPVWDRQISRNQQFVCATWRSGIGWSSDECSSSRRQSTAHLTCQCHILGNYTVIVKDVPEQTTITAATTPSSSSLPSTLAVATTSTSTIPSTMLTTLTTTAEPTTVRTTQTTTTTKMTTKLSLVKPTKRMFTTTTTTTRRPVNPPLPPPTQTSVSKEPTLSLAPVRTTTEKASQVNISTVTLVHVATEAGPLSEATNDQSAVTPEVALTTSPSSVHVVSNITYNVSFRIEENYNETVGENKEQFEDALRQQIMKQVEMPDPMMVEISISSGSIVVHMRLADTDVKTVQEVIPQIASLLHRGELVVEGLDHRRLDVPPQPLNLIQPHQPEPSMAVVYAVGGYAAFSVASVMVFGVTAAVLRRKRSGHAPRKRQQIISKGQTPSYRQFQFEKSIDGSEASLARYRTSVPSMGTVSTLSGLSALDKETIQYLQVDGSLCQPLAGARRRGKKKSKRKQQGLLRQEESDDRDSGIVVTDSVHHHGSHRRMQNTTASTASFDALPGTPTDD